MTNTNQPPTPSSPAGTRTDPFMPPWLGLILAAVAAHLFLILRLTDVAPIAALVCTAMLVWLAYQTALSPAWRVLLAAVYVGMAAVSGRLAAVVAQGWSDFPAKVAAGAVPEPVSMDNGFVLLSTMGAVDVPCAIVLAVGALYSVYTRRRRART